ncbi:MAG: hypothetical protein ACREKQ_02700 [Candidatus Rokuibacteriota bacterium]
MDTNGRQSPERIRAGLSHPIQVRRFLRMSVAARLWGTDTPAGAGR